MCVWCNLLVNLSGQGSVSVRLFFFLFFFVRRPDLECQLGHTYPLFLVASFLLPFQHFTSFLPPGLKPTRATVHSRKRSESFFLLFCANHPPTPFYPQQLCFHFHTASPFLSQVISFSLVFTQDYYEEKKNIKKRPQNNLKVTVI